MSIALGGKAYLNIFIDLIAVYNFRSESLAQTEGSTSKHKSNLFSRRRRLGATRKKKVSMAYFSCDKQL